MVKQFSVFLLLIAFSLAQQQFSLSGIGAGANMAVQLNVAYSASTVGAGLIAGAPYWCAQGSQVISTSACANAAYLINVNSLVQYTKEQASTGNIDPILDLQNDRIWLFSGLKDTVVNQGVVKKLYSYYSSFINSYKINTTYDQQAEYAWITNGTGNPCWYLGSPYLNHCKLDTAGILLKYIYGTLNDAVGQNFANLYSFPQHEFAGNSAAGLDTNGWIYQPSYCTENACKLHVALHGCGMNYVAIGDKFIKGTNLNGWAEANNIVILYPQVLAQSGRNIEGCWDWWGYTGENYAVKSGLQMAAIYNMTQSLETISSFRLN